MDFLKKFVNEKTGKTVTAAGADVVSDILEKTKEELDSMEPIRIMLIGKTGVGKSTLINSIFRENLATEGIGLPVTEHITRITKKGVPIVLYDTKGLELSDEKTEKVKEEVREYTELKPEDPENEKRADVIWYCINSAGNRIEEKETEWIKELSKKLPVIIVLTFSFHKETSDMLKAYIEEMKLGEKAVIKVLSKPMSFGKFNISSFGLKELVDITYDVMNEEKGKAFINAQKVDIDKKAEVAAKWARGFIYETFLVGFVPIPFADAPIISASQAAMIAKITAIFGVSYDKALFTSIVSATAGISGAVVSGRYLVTNLLKIIPGAGTITSGLISGSTAAVITTAMAYAYINVMKKVAIEEYKGNKLLPTEITDLMKKELDKYIKK